MQIEQCCLFIRIKLKLHSSSQVIFVCRSIWRMSKFNVYQTLRRPTMSAAAAKNKTITRTWPSISASSIYKLISPIASTIRVLFTRCCCWFRVDHSQNLPPIVIRTIASSSLARWTFQSKLEALGWGSKNETDKRAETYFADSLSWPLLQNAKSSNVSQEIRK